jgi:hypothetical protein
MKSLKFEIFLSKIQIFERIIYTFHYNFNGILDKYVLLAMIENY